MQNSFNNLRPDIQKNLRENAKKYSTVKSLVYRLRGTGNRYNLSFDDIRDVIYWGGANSQISVSEVYNAIFKN